MFHVDISSIKVGQKWGSFIDIFGGSLGFLIRDLEDMAVLDVMDDMI